MYAPEQQGQLSSWRTMWDVHAHTLILEQVRDQMPFPRLPCTALRCAPNVSLCHYTACICYRILIPLQSVVHSLPTHRKRQFEAKQFLAVLMRCGGSEKKKSSLFPSLAWMLGTLCVSVPLELLCSLTIFRLFEAPSNVAASTYRWHILKFLATCM